MKGLVFLSLFLFILLIGNSCYYDNKEELYQYVQAQNCDSLSTSTFTADVVPVLLTHCTRCHRNGREDGNVNLEGFNNVKPYATDGSLYGSSNHQAPYAIMPPGAPKIPSCDLEKIRIWVDGGALNN